MVRGALDSWKAQVFYYWVHQDARRAPDVLMGAGVKIMASGD